MKLDEVAKIYQSKIYQDRVKELEAEGMTTSDAQGVADVEFNLIITI